jgi:hypothetical protein
VVSIAFTEALYTVPGPTPSHSTSVQVTVTGIADGATINWNIITSSGNPSEMATFSAPSSPVSGGKANVIISGANVSRNVTITATLASDNSKADNATVQFLNSDGNPLPSDFLALFDDDSTSTKNWVGAGTFCSNQGGKLPLINGASSLPYPVPFDAVIDGFGPLGVSWPSALPSDGYWTGTGYSVVAGNSWYVDGGGDVVVYDGYQSDGLRVACVPLA